MRLEKMGKWMAVVSAVMVVSAAVAVNAWAAEKLGRVTGLYWNEDDDNDEKITEAIWDEVEDAYEYEAALYRDGKRVKTIPTKKTKFNFKKYMDTEGDYTFKVRAMAKAKNKKFSNGSWSEESDAVYISEARAEYNKNGKKKDTSQEGPGMSDGGTSSASTSVVSSSSSSGSTSGSVGAWIEDSTGWWYRRADGTYPMNQWFQDPADGRYYMFDERGYMVTGWIVWEGKHYYCDPDRSPIGAMVTGEVIIDGVTYHFDDTGAAAQDTILPENVR